VEKAARIAREPGIPVSCDVDTIYPGFDRVLPLVDYLVSSSEFPARWAGECDPFRALELIQNTHGMRIAAMTSPGFVVDCVATTGAGDVFHGTFCYSVINGMSLSDGLDFSCAMAALNCTQLGARGGIVTLDQAHALIATAERRIWPGAVRT
jgi:sugar/nucleoside kinase (ribokinase family)